MSHVAHAVRLRTSTRLHYVLLRFTMISLSSSIVDNLVFFLVFHASRSIAGAQLAAKTTSLVFNYYFVRRSVFFAGAGHHVLFPRYVLLAGLNAVTSYAGIKLVSGATPIGVMVSKMLVETLLFGANFTIQRAYVFRHKGRAEQLPEATHV